MCQSDFRHVISFPSLSLCCLSVELFCFVLCNNEDHTHKCFTPTCNLALSRYMQPEGILLKRPRLFAKTKIVCKSRQTDGFIMSLCINWTPFFIFNQINTFVSLHAALFSQTLKPACLKINARDFWPIPPEAKPMQSKHKRSILQVYETG